MNSIDKKTLFKYRNLILLVIVIAVSLVVVILVLIPQFQSYWANRGKASELSQKAQVIEQKVTDLKAVDQGEVNNDLKVVLTVLPKDQKVTDAIVIMQNLAALSGLGVTQLGYTSNAKDNSGSFKIEMGLSGQVANVNNLLKQLNQSSRIIQVDNISIESQTDGYNISIPFVFYFKPPPSGSTPEDQAVQKLTESERSLIAQLTAGTDLTQSIQSSASATIKLGKDDPFN